MGTFGNREGTLGTLSEPWEPREPLLGNLGTFTWEPLLGNLYLEPGNLGGMGFGAGNLYYGAVGEQKVLLPAQ